MNQKKITIADDDPAILDAVAVMLEFAGYKVDCISDGNDLLAKDGPFTDLLLLDIWMSGTDGREICRQLKQNKTTANVPIVLISASKDIGRSALEAGADDFLPKPFDMEDLIKKIESHIHA